MAKPKKEEPKVFNPELTIGGSDKTDNSDKATIECSDCGNVNFLVQIEPDYENVDASSVRENFEVPSRRVMFCPFCGGENLNEV